MISSCWGMYMPASVDLRSLADSLNVYHKQLEALGEALSALRGLSDVMIAGVERDRAMLAALLPTAQGGDPGLQPVDEPGRDQGAVLGVTGEDFVVEPWTGPPGDDVSGAVMMVEIGSDPDVPETNANAADRSVMLAGAGRDVPGLDDAMSELRPDVTATPDGAFESLPVEVVAPAMAATVGADVAVAADVLPSAAENGAVDVDATHLAHAGHVDATPAQALSPVVAPGEVPGSSTGSGQVAATQDMPMTVTLAQSGSNVVDLAAERQVRASRSPARTRALAVVASLFLATTATLGVHELLRSEFGQRVLELSTCDGDAFSASRDCTLLAWLMI
jgi:hypothetical protein